MSNQLSARVIREIATAMGVKRVSAAKLDERRKEAKQKMWEFYSANKSTISKSVRENRDEIIIELMKGVSVEEVFRESMEASNSAIQLLEAA